MFQNIIMLLEQNAIAIIFDLVNTETSMTAMMKE